MKQALDLTQLQAEYQALLGNSGSLLLATGNSDGTADIGYAPYLFQENHFYIYVSQLAKHTENLLRTPQVTVMILQPETDTGNVFARQRLKFNCRVAEISRDTPLYATLLNGMLEHFGGVVEVLRSLPDFHLLALEIQHGQFIAGFGQAFTIELASGALQAH